MYTKETKVCEFRQKPIFPSAEGQYGDGIFNTFLACKRLTGLMVYGGGANFKNNFVFSDYPILYPNFICIDTVQAD